MTPSSRLESDQSRSTLRLAAKVKGISFVAIEILDTKGCSTVMQLIGGPELLEFVRASSRHAYQLAERGITVEVED